MVARVRGGADRAARVAAPAPGATRARSDADRADGDARPAARRARLPADGAGVDGRPPRTPAIAFLQRHRADGRIASVNIVAADWTTVYGLRDVGGFDAPAARHFRLARMLRMTLAPPEANGGLPFDASTQRAFGLLGARICCSLQACRPR